MAIGKLRLLVCADTPKERIDKYIKLILRFHQRPASQKELVEVVQWEEGSDLCVDVDDETRLYADPRIGDKLSPAELVNWQTKWDPERGIFAYRGGAPGRAMPKKATLEGAETRARKRGIMRTVRHLEEPDDFDNDRYID